MRVEADSRPPIPDPLRSVVEQTGRKKEEVLQVLSGVDPKDYKNWPIEVKEKFHDVVTTLRAAVDEWKAGYDGGRRVEGSRAAVESLDRLLDAGKAEAARGLKKEVEDWKKGMAALKKGGKVRKVAATARTPSPEFERVLAAGVARAAEDRALNDLMADRSEGAAKKLQDFLVANPGVHERLKKKRSASSSVPLLLPDPVVEVSISQGIPYDEVMKILNTPASKYPNLTPKERAKFYAVFDLIESTVREDRLLLEKKQLHPSYGRTIRELEPLLTPEKLTAVWSFEGEFIRVAKDPKGRGLTTRRVVGRTPAQRGGEELERAVGSAVEKRKMEETFLSMLKDTREGAGVRLEQYVLENPHMFGDFQKVLKQATTTPNGLNEKQVKLVKDLGGRTERGEPKHPALHARFFEKPDYSILGDIRDGGITTHMGTNEINVLALASLPESQYQNLTDDQLRRVSKTLHALKALVGVDRRTGELSEKIDGARSIGVARHNAQLKKLEALLGPEKFAALARRGIRDGAPGQPGEYKPAASEGRRPARVPERLPRVQTTNARRAAEKARSVALSKLGAVGALGFVPRRGAAAEAAIKGRIGTVPPPRPLARDSGAAARLRSGIPDVTYRPILSRTRGRPSRAPRDGD